MSSSTKKFFPIKQGVACQLKWTWNTVRLMEGTTGCCHRVKTVPLDPNNFDEFHNYPTWVKHRELQLQGIFPDQGCQYCGDIEKAGGTSDRMMHLNMENMYPPELDTDSLATNVTPRIIEVFLNNTCNLSCVYCDESNSSRIANENIKFGYSIPGIPDELREIDKVSRVDHYEKLVDKFFLYLDKNYLTIRRLGVLGGEPFYQKEFTRLMEFVKSKSNPELELNIITNLMVSKKILQEFINDMRTLLSKRKLRMLNITVSLDGDGKSEEYVRYGLDIQKWKENYELLASNKWIHVGVNSTMTSLSIPNMPALLDYIKEVSDKTNRTLNYEFGLVVGHGPMHPAVFGPGFFDAYFEKIISKLPIRNQREESLRDYMIGIKNLIDNSTENVNYQYYLKCILEEYDRRRGTDWKENFPHLVEKLVNLTKSL